MMQAIGVLPVPPIEPRWASRALLGVKRFLRGAGAKASPHDLALQFGKILWGASEPLRRTESRDEFDRVFDLVAQPTFIVELLSVTLHPEFKELGRAAQAASLRAPPVSDATARELLYDLIERFDLLTKLAGLPGQRPRSREKIAALVGRVAAMPDAAALARYLVATIALTSAAYGGEPWKEWKRSALWWIGQEAVMSLAHHAGVPATEAADQIYTTRDRRLAASIVGARRARETVAALGLK